MTRGYPIKEVEMILGTNDSWVQHAIKLVRSAKYRSSQQKSLIFSTQNYCEPV